MDRQFLINEIKRLANENGGKPPGQEKFRRETGVSPAQWRGIHWVNWSAALAEAGFEPNSFDVAFDKDFLLENLATAVRDLKKFPTEPELMLYAREKINFPHPKAFQRHFRNRGERVGALNAYCERHNDLSDVLEICRPLMGSEPKANDREKPTKRIIKGFVYLMRSGKYYKIGKSKHVGGREYQIGLKLPETVTTLHSIETDDPEGIEVYWHNRFKDKRAGGEWFTLTPDDIKAFKLRKFM
ncbi:GIY-YIG nuclease family protein [Methylocapsa polymorpha]|uniref:GIY-YIG nuclease family protein n=1 Tax=Methylocapsa polymorpha TaxID=3080828 RepID=A0ABZ0HT54_9HYPH|nr:GIY-YIG nuclease family protein [Methylocapsa sp. RX1]